ncbi:MAG TPA: aminodeoxychorismate lyase [Luteimonas sp.]|nr:aminodeoxychorismate lyase [Luteimonas sp.]
MTARVFVGDRRVDAIPADDRGVAYGDGLFETMRVHAGDAPWWDAHWARLQRGAQRLRTPLPDEAQVRSEARALFDDHGDGVLKLIVTRGGGDRGYASPVNGLPTWVLLRHVLPEQSRHEGLAMRWCETHLALQPALAGIKHCNRLEQVLARAEWDDPLAPDRDADEGLMRSSDGDVVCATAANLFVLRDDLWWTPTIDRCGVAGICRAHLLPLLQAREGRLSMAQVETADAIFLCNAVRGILTVARLGAHTWPSHPAVAAARRQLAQTHPGFAIDAEVS